MIDKIKKKLEKLNFDNWVQILLHPVLIPFAMIPAWFKSLWNSRILLWGQWSRYHGFNAQNAINSLFYRTQWISINRYGRLANSPIIGLGKFPLSNWWHLSSLASYFYANAGAVTTLLGLLFLVLSHLIWIQSASWVWVLIVTALFLFSSTSYIMAFARQNYQILAWMFIPVGLYGLLNSQWIVAAAAFLIASVLGVTAFVVSIYLVLIYVVYSSNYQMLWLMLPASIAVTIKMVPLFVKGNARESLMNMAKLIGLVHVKVRYKRTSMGFGLFNVYMLMLYGFSLGLVWLAKQDVPIFMFAAVVLFLINQRFLRFADDQSVVLTVAMAAVVEILIAPFNWLALAGLVIVLNPILKFFQAGEYVVPIISSPFDTEKMLIKLHDFFDCISSGERVLFSFNDPQGVYENIFDGYRILYEAPLVVAAERKIHLIPDWHAVLETNHENAPPIWGKSVDEVRSNMNYWQANYAIIYQDSGTQLSNEWRDQFEVVAEFDWLSVYEEKIILETISKSLKPPKWWLVKNNRFPILKKYAGKKLFSSSNIGNHEAVLNRMHNASSNR